VAAVNKAKLQGAKSGEASATPVAAGASASATGPASGSPSAGTTAMVTGWREHRDIFSAARRTLDMPGSKELVGLAPHRITTVQQPAVSILVDGRRVHTLQLRLSIFFEVTGLVAGIHAGRLAAIHAGRGEVGVALTIHELEVLTRRSHLELPGVKSLKRGFRLLPASEYPDESPAYLGGQHPGSQLPGAELPAAVTAAAHFPGVDLRDGYVPPPDLRDGVR